MIVIWPYHPPPPINIIIHLHHCCHTQYYQFRSKFYAKENFEYLTNAFPGLWASLIKNILLLFPILNESKKFALVIFWHYSEVYPVAFISIKMLKRRIKNMNRSKTKSQCIYLCFSSWHRNQIIYLTIRIRAGNFCRLAMNIESEYSNCFSKNSEEQTKEQRYFFDKQLLNLFKQPMLIIKQRLFNEWNCQIDTSNPFFSYLWIFLYHNFLLFQFSLGLVFE